MMKAEVMHRVSGVKDLLPTGTIVVIVNTYVNVRDEVWAICIWPKGNIDKIHTGFLKVLAIPQVSMVVLEEPSKDVKKQESEEANERTSSTESGRVARSGSKNKQHNR